MMLEGYYLSGIPIDLSKFNLGTIRQLRYIDLVKEEINTDMLLRPFAVTKDSLKGNSEELDAAIDKIGTLGLLLFADENNCNTEMKDNIIYSLSVLYNEDNIYFDANNNNIYVGDSIIVDNSNFDTLSTVVMEMFKSKRVKADKPKEMDELDKEFERRRKLNESKTKKKNKNELELKDIVNVIVHTSECGLDYDKVVNMTIYQIKNTFETLSFKHNTENTFSQMMSSNFDPSKIKIKDWKSEKIVKSSDIN